MMRNLKWYVFSISLGLIFSIAHAATEYDFYKLNAYPGPVIVDNVDLYKPIQEGNGNPQAYERRAVEWWPMKGVDYVVVEEGMPLRMWTLRDPLDVTGRSSETENRYPSSLPKTFKAHLIGFRGIGNEMYSPFWDNPGPIIPAAVLRLEDGSKKCFTRGSFSPEDEKYLLDLYLKEMERIQAGIDKTEYVERPRTIAEFPNNAKPGEPGTMRITSEHFSYVSGSQAGEENDPWVNERYPEKAEMFRKGTLNMAEYWWAFSEYIGHLMPYWDRTEKYKYVVTVAGTKRDGYSVIGGFAGGGYGGSTNKWALGGPWSPGLWHEWGHGGRANRAWDVGGGEVYADFHQIMGDPDIPKYGNNINRPWRNCVHGAYATGMFPTIMGENPNWGYCFYDAVSIGAEEATPFHTIARVGEHRGLFENGIRGAGDMVGEFYARTAESDSEIQHRIRKVFMMTQRSWLEPVHKERGIYQIPWEIAPEPFGGNVIRLNAEDDAQEIVVNLHGVHNPDDFGDWRACIVAVGADGKVRYSKLWNKGEMTMPVKEGDRRFWLTVAATPTALPHAERHFYYGKFAPRYPYQVKLTGAVPGSPRPSRADLDDSEFVYGMPWSLADTVPLPTDTRRGDAFAKEVRQFAQKLDQLETRAGNNEYVLNNIKEIKHKVQSYLASLKGHRHPNGGGWVAESAKVAATAYVGPEAMVLDGASVLDNAVLEDYAVVSGPGVVIKDQAKVSGGAFISGEVVMDKYDRTWQNVDGTRKPQETESVPLRPFDNAVREDKLWANYAMDQSEKTILEDWFRFAYKNNSSWTLNIPPVNLNGYIYGEPEFVTDGERQGFRFNGRNQYAVCSPFLADLGAMTIDISCKHEGSQQQTLFDFGSDTNNYFALSLLADGTAELNAVVDGRQVIHLSGEEKVPAGKWSRLRLESDGSMTSLWLNGRKIAGQPSAFRPTQVYPPDKMKRNYLAVSRNGHHFFEGTIDYVVVYHDVHEDFDNLPEPIRDAPRRVTFEYAKAYEKQVGNVERLKLKLDFELKKWMQYYDNIKRRLDARLLEIENASPEVVAIKKKLAEAKTALQDAKKEAEASFAKQPEYTPLVQEVERLREQERELKRLTDPKERAFFEKDPQFEKLQTERASLKKKIDELQEQAKEFPEYIKLEKKLETVEQEYKEAQAANSLRLEDIRQRLNDLRRDSNMMAVYLAGRIEGYRDLENSFKKINDKIKQRLEKRREDAREAIPELKELDSISEEIREKARNLHQQREFYAQRKATEAEMAAGEIEAELHEARQKAYEHYHPEYLWLKALHRQAFHRYYNTHYEWFLEDKIKAEIGGGENREDLELLTKLEQARENWSTKVDWEWRMPEEVDGSIAELPLMQKWLKRVRGPVMTRQTANSK